MCPFSLHFFMLKWRRLVNFDFFLCKNIFILHCTTVEKKKLLFQSTHEPTIKPRGVTFIYLNINNPNFLISPIYSSTVHFFMKIFEFYEWFMFVGKCFNINLTDFCIYKVKSSVDSLPKLFQFKFIVPNLTKMNEATNLYLVYWLSYNIC